MLNQLGYSIKGVGVENSYSPSTLVFRESNIYFKVVTPLKMYNEPKGWFPLGSSKRENVFSWHDFTSALSIGSFRFSLAE